MNAVWKWEVIFRLLSRWIGKLRLFIPARIIVTTHLKPPVCKDSMLFYVYVLKAILGLFVAKRLAML